MRRRIRTILLVIIVVSLAGLLPASETMAAVTSSNVLSDASIVDKKSDCVDIIMVGDILLHDGVERCSLKEDGSYDFTPIFANTRTEIAGADLAIVNQEVIIGGEELGVSGYPCFNAPYEIGDALYAAGFDVICQGTNHALDKGKNGILNCLNFWKTKYPGEAVIGINESEAEQNAVYICEKKGIRIAVLNYTYGTNGIPFPKGMPYAVNMLNKERVKLDLEYAENNADFTIVCPHWGTEYSLEATNNQKKWAEFFAENGADLIIGTHPHVIEPIEWVESGVTKERALCYYSIGNYVNWTSGKGNKVIARMVGGMAKVSLKRNEAGKAEICDYGVEPLVCHLEKRFGGATVYKLSDYTDSLADRNEIKSQVANFSLEACKEIVEQVWGN